MKLLQLLWSFLQIGLFSIGGGYATLPLIQAQIVDAHGWLTLQELSDIVTLSQMTPGPLAVNASTFVGIRVAGIPGAIVATLGCVTPGIVLAMILFTVFTRTKAPAVKGLLTGMRAASVGLIGATAFTLTLTALCGAATFAGVNLSALIVFAFCMLLAARDCSPVLLIALSGVMGLILYL